MTKNLFSKCTATVIVTGIICAASTAAIAQSAPTFATREGDFITHDFKFRSGETLPTLKLHYTTLGTPKRDADGHVTNAVIVMHGTGGSGQQFLRPQFANILFAPDGLLDPATMYVILPDGIGHGKSSKPSDGLHARFPKYDYDDMVAAQYALVTQGLGVDHLRLVMGTSMGCMHSFVWGETYPTFMDALMPLACQPVAIAGRNRAWRKMIIDGITNDPAWQNGDYKIQPQQGLRTAADMLLIAGSAPHQLQKEYSTRDAADTYVADHVKKDLATLDANDVLYQVSASRNYDPSANLDKITAPMIWVNSADDFINPPDTNIAQAQAKKIKNGRYVLIPTSDQTHGHGTHTYAAVWQSYLAQLLKESTQKTAAK